MKKCIYYTLIISCFLVDQIDCMFDPEAPTIEELRAKLSEIKSIGTSLGKIHYINKILGDNNYIEKTIRIALFRIKKFFKSETELEKEKKDLLTHAEETIKLTDIWEVCIVVEQDEKITMKNYLVKKIKNQASYLINILKNN